MREVIWPDDAVPHDDTPITSHTTLWSGKLGPIKTEFFTGPAHHAQVENLARASKGNLRLSAFSMHRTMCGNSRGATKQTPLAAPCSVAMRAAFVALRRQAAR
jgi:hypothetical protein